MGAGAQYTKSIASLELCHKEHNSDPYSLHNNTIERDNSAYIDLVYQASPSLGSGQLRITHTHTNAC